MVVRHLEDAEGRVTGLRYYGCSRRAAARSTHLHDADDRAVGVRHQPLHHEDDLALTHVAARVLFDALLLELQAHDVELVVAQHAVDALEPPLEPLLVAHEQDENLSRGGSQACGLGAEPAAPGRR